MYKLFFFNLFAYSLLLYVTAICNSLSIGRMEMKLSLQRCSYSISFSSLNENEVAQLCPTLCDLKDCRPAGSSIHGLLQARILERAAIPPPGDLPDPEFEPRSPALLADSLPPEPPGNPYI